MFHVGMSNESGIPDVYDSLSCFLFIRDGKDEQQHDYVACHNIGVHVVDDYEKGFGVRLRQRGNRFDNVTKISRSYTLCQLTLDHTITYISYLGTRCSCHFDDSALHYCRAAGHRYLTYCPKGISSFRSAVGPDRAQRWAHGTPASIAVSKSAPSKETCSHACGSSNAQSGSLCYSTVRRSVLGGVMK